MTSCLSSVSISHHNLLPHVPSVHLSAVSSSSHSGIVLQSLHSSSQPLGTCLHVQLTYGCSKDCLILIPFSLSQISCFTFSLQCFSSAPDNCPSVGIRLPLQFPHTIKGWSSIMTPVFVCVCVCVCVLFFPLISFILPSFACFYILFSDCQLLLSTLSWCFANTFVYKDVFLMYLWREMYSTSNYSSPILFYVISFLSQYFFLMVLKAFHNFTSHTLSQSCSYLNYCF